MIDHHLLLSLFHIAVIVPFFLYIGFQRAATPESIYNVLFGIGLLILAYHGSKAIIRIVANSPGAWINLIHVCIISPLMLYIGYNGKKTQRPAYEMLLMVGFAALGYHLKTLIISSQTFLKNDD